MNDQGRRRLVVAPLRRPEHSLTRQSTDALRELILTGALRPGERLNEIELAEALQASRGPLREAIQRLAAQGLLTVVNGKGAYVKDFTSDDLRELYELRAVLETHAVRVGAARSSDEALASLSALLDATEAAFLAGGEQSYPRDRDFHEGLMSLAGNTRLAEASRGVQDLLQIARFRSGQSPTRAAAALEEHRMVLNRLLMRDGEGAASDLQRHLDASLVNSRTLFEQQAEEGRIERRTGW